MPSRDVNAVTRLAEASWWRDNDRKGAGSKVGKEAWLSSTLLCSQKIVIK